MQQPEIIKKRAFRVGRWTVQPDLNRVVDDGGVVQLEPKAMELLIFLADHAGEVVSRREIIDGVWQQDFVGDSTLSSAVAVLRRALDDDIREPRYIETIAKRGYRLVAEVVSEEALASVTPFPGLMMPPPRSPYPGLAAFSESESQYFFGREEEVAALWGKIPRQRLLAVIGPSGVGKTSFIRAGVIPAAPEDWQLLVATPGEAPFDALGQALAPEFSGDSSAVQQLLACHDPDVALSLFSRWRERRDEALVVIDQFEELFTLNETSVQSGFAELLNRLVEAARIHVVLVLRDDFLYQCHAYPGLERVFRELSVLKPLSPSDLERAMIEPALQIGYRFEDETLASDMVAEVSGERAGTPMLAFTMARLWEMRDREARLISRHAFEAIGGVSGSLAQHAEEVMRGIGDGRKNQVREIFRNLVSAQGTRATREVEELLSVFPADQRESAIAVLRELIRGRLLTSFEPRSPDEKADSRRRRVEIAHESLLTTWPRLLRWRTQDADAVQLRDQVRQAAQLWNDHNRSPDLLWTGSAFRELRVWRENYPGGLSAVESAFVEQSRQHAGRRRRRRRIAVAGGVLILTAITLIVTGLWRQSARQARRAEARRLFHLGQLAVERAPGSALTWAMASLELEDDADVRRLALKALVKGPKGLLASKGGSDDGYALAAQFSPDGKWLAASYWSGEIALWPADGGEATVWQAHGGPTLLWFSPDSSTLMSGAWMELNHRFWSVPDGRLVQETPIDLLEIPGGGDWVALKGNLLNVMSPSRTSGAEGVEWQVDARRERLMGWLYSEENRLGVVDSSSELAIIAVGASLYVAPLDRPSFLDESTWRMVGRHERGFQQLAFAPDTQRVATIDTAGGVQLWSLAPDSWGLVRSWTGDGKERCTALNFDPTESYLASSHGDGYIRVWGIADPAGAEPLRILADTVGVFGLGFHPDGKWIASTSPGGLAIRPFDRARYGYVLPGHGGSVDELLFSPDGTLLISASSDGTVRLWPLDGSQGKTARVLLDWNTSASIAGLSSIALAPDGQFLAAAIGGVDRLLVVTLDGEVTHELPLPPGDAHALAVSPSSGTVAVGCVGSRQGVDGELTLGGTLILWDPATGEVIDSNVENLGGTFQTLAFAGDGAVLMAGGNGLVRWDGSDTQPVLIREALQSFAYCRAHDTVLGAISDGGPWTAAIHDLATETTRSLPRHGEIGLVLNVATILAVDSACSVIASVRDRELQVGLSSGETPHLLLGHEDSIHSVALSPDGRWIAAGSRDGTIRLWPVPDLNRQPLHTLPRTELLALLKKITLGRRVRDESASNSYTFARAPFPGWETRPEW